MSMHFLFGWVAWMALLIVLAFTLFAANVVWYIRMRRYLSVNDPLKWQEFKQSGALIFGIPTNYRDWGILKEAEEGDDKFLFIKHKLGLIRRYYIVVMSLFGLSMLLMVGVVLICG